MYIYRMKNYSLINIYREHNFCGFVISSHASPGIIAAKLAAEAKIGTVDKINVHFKVGTCILHKKNFAYIYSDQFEFS